MNVPIRRSDSYKTKRFWWIRVKYRAKLLLSSYPLIETPVMLVWRTSRFLYWRFKSKLVFFIGSLLTDSYSKEIDADKIYWVSPQKIAYASLKEFSVHHFKGRIIEGEWDLLKKKIEDLDIYIAFNQVCIEGKDWTETIFYQLILNRLNKGAVIWGCKNKSDFDQRCKDLELLFYNIKHNGYKSQNDLLQSQKVYDSRNINEEIGGSIGRDGDLLFCDGAHRLAIANLLNIPKIPVKIAVRHRKWMNFKKELLLYAKDQGGKTSQPCMHPDLSEIPVFHKCEDRFMMIKNNLSAKQGRLLDIGANFGYFSHRFEDEGFDCYAVEHCPTTSYFLKKLKRAENRKFRTITASIIESEEVRYTSFNVILALNIFHHFLKTKEAYYKFIDLLGNLQMNELFFEPHDPNEVQMEGAYKNYSPHDFIAFMIQNSKLENAYFIGVTNDQRPLYKLY